jgi:hypothetical protein
MGVVADMVAFQDVCDVVLRDGVEGGCGVRDVLALVLGKDVERWCREAVSKSRAESWYLEVGRVERGLDT